MEKYEGVAKPVKYEDYHGIIKFDSLTQIICDKRPTARSIFDIEDFYILEIYTSPKETVLCLIDSAPHPHHFFIFMGTEKNDIVFFETHKADNQKFYEYIRYKFDRRIRKRIVERYCFWTWRQEVESNSF